MQQAWNNCFNHACKRIRLEAKTSRLQSFRKRDFSWLCKHCILLNKLKGCAVLRINMIMNNEIKAVIFDFNGVFNENVEYRIVREGSRRLGCLFVLSCISYFYWHFAHQTGKLNSFDFWKKVFFG